MSRITADHRRRPQPAARHFSPSAARRHPAAGLDLFQIGRLDGLVPDAVDLADFLRAVGLRVTRPRLAVLDAVHAQPHVDTETLIDAARARLGAVSHQAVYDVLRALTDTGLVR